MDEIIIKNAISYLVACYQIGFGRFDLLCPEVYNLHAREAEWRGRQVYAGNLEHFKDLILQLFTGNNLEFNFSNFKYCSAGHHADIYFIDGLFRLMKGEDFATLMEERHNQHQAEIEKLNRTATTSITNETSNLIAALQNKLAEQTAIADAALELAKRELRESLKKNLRDMPGLVDDIMKKML